MTQPLSRRLGAIAVVAGLMLSLFGLIGSALPAGAAPETEGQVCNNQKDRPEQDCVGENSHGTVATSYNGDGDLVFTITSTGATEWKQFYLCIPSSGRTNGADCQGNTPTLIEPAGNYVVTTPVTNTVEDKSVSFAPTKTIVVTVEKAVFESLSSFSYTIHVNTANGGTDEAFGDETPPAPVTDTPEYKCVSPTEITTTSATLRGSTTDSTVDAATFTFTEGAATTFNDSDKTDGFSAAVTGLSAGTSYKYKVEFKTGSTVDGTATCAFSTQPAPDTYVCEAPSGVTSTGATLKGRTSNGEVDTAAFKLTPAGGTAATVAAAETGNSNQWSASATNLTPSTKYTYSLEFKDGNDLVGTGANADVCTFTTLAAASIVAVVDGNTQTQQPAGVAPAAAAVTPPPVDVAGVQLAAPAAAPATAANTLPRTGSSTGTLLPLGIGLVLLGVLAIVMGRRNELVPVPVFASTVEAPRAGPPSTDKGRSVLILGGLLLLGAVLPRSAGRRNR